jgi:hypothetical protein
MKLSAIVILTMMSGLVQCQRHLSRNVSTVTLTAHQYPSNNDFLYVIDSASIKVHALQKKTGTDTLAMQQQIEVSNFINCATLIKNFTKDRYIDTCIEDGQVFTLVFEKDSSVLKRVMFSNFYNKYLARLITFVNSKVTAPYKIRYNKDELTKASSNCK